MCDYEVLLKRLYLHPENSSYNLLVELQHKLANETWSKARRKLEVAIKVCENKIILMLLDVKLLQIKITNLLKLNLFTETAGESAAEEQLVAQRKQLYRI